MGFSKLFYVLTISLYFIGGLLSAELSKEIATETSDHGESFQLGKVKILGKEFKVYRLGDFNPGEEGAFEVISDGDVSGITVYFWVESQDGKRLSAPSQASLSNGKAHFHVLVQKGAIPFRAVLRVRQGEKDERGSVPLNP